MRSSKSSSRRAPRRTQKDAPAILDTAAPLITYTISPHLTSRQPSLLFNPFGGARAQRVPSSPARPQGEVALPDARPVSVVEYLEAEELEDDGTSSVPKALAVNLPTTTAQDSRYSMYSLRELPCVTAEEIQEI